MRRRYRKPDPFTGLILGAISGLAGTLLMTQFQNVWNKVSEAMHRSTEDEAKPEKEPKEDSTMKAAGKISEGIGRPLSRAERKKAGPWIHYAFGTTVGAVFGLAMESGPASAAAINPALAGAGYGAAIFLAAHEIAVP